MHRKTFLICFGAGLYNVCVYSFYCTNSTGRQTATRLHRWAK